MKKIFLVALTAALVEAARYTAKIIIDSLSKK